MSRRVSSLKLEIKKEKFGSIRFGSEKLAEFGSFTCRCGAQKQGIRLPHSLDSVECVLSWIFHFSSLLDCKLVTEVIMFTLSSISFICAFKFQSIRRANIEVKIDRVN